MANALKNASLLLSPKFLSPLSPSRNLLTLPKSDGKIYFRQKCRPTMVKKLNFSPAQNRPSGSLHLSKIPDIKIQNEVDVIAQKFDIKQISNALDINTPNKLNLIRYGLDKFKNSTTVLGKGSFGTVFKGKHKGETVAVKIVTSESTLKERNALKLTHKNIVKTFEIIENSGHQNYNLIIMEYLPSCRSLQEVLDDTRQDIQLKKFAIDITTGLDYLHKNRIIHLDLKPKNILVDVEKLCKICDFGNSLNLEENFNNFQYNGTIIYTAPEILLGQQPTEKSDIYSLGLIFWQMRFRRTPFQEYDSMETIIYNVGKHDVRPLYNIDKSDVFQTIFIRCWDGIAEMRPKCEDILIDLKRAQI